MSVNMMTKRVSSIKDLVRAVKESFMPVESRNYACTLALTSSSPREGGRAGVENEVGCGYRVRSRQGERLKRDLKRTDCDEIESTNPRGWEGGMLRKGRGYQDKRHAL